ncbi:hypothetical protein ABLAC_18210 [Acinetobacter baumannii LAC-4]|nr:hypothetical protein ABLAC_18210 [Acinetobacter baumannii LAC-4]EKL44505.1 hypothetical protein ACIN5098_1093 [Acinetobacter baumannii OIFC098]
MGYFAPTYPQIRDIFFPTIEEVAFDWGLKTKVYETNKEVDIYYGRQYRTTIICRSMEDIITVDINFAQVRTAPTIVRALV